METETKQNAVGAEPGGRNEAPPEPAGPAGPPSDVEAEAEGLPGVGEACGPDVIAELARLPTGALVTERGLARVFGKCTASIRAAVDRGELPPPVRLMGKRTWTAGGIVRHHEARLEAEARKFQRLRA